MPRRPHSLHEPAAPKSCPWSCAGRWPLHPDKAQNASWIYLDGHWSDEAPYIVGCNAMQKNGFNCSTRILLHGRQSVRIGFCGSWERSIRRHLQPNLCDSHHTCPCSFWPPEQSCGDIASSGDRQTVISLAEPESGLVLMRRRRRLPESSCTNLHTSI